MKNGTLKLKLSLLFTGILFLLTFAFSSCSDSLNDETTPNPKVTLKGTIALSGALPSELVSGSLEADSPSRAAFPTTTGCTYSVTAVCTNPAESVNGTVSGNSYSIELTLGRTYTVTAALKNGDSVIFSDDWENVEVTRGNAATLSHDFILKGKSGGSGSIELNITVPSSVKSVKASSSSSGWDSSSPSFTLDSTTATLSCSSINAGTYEVELDFYNSTDESNRILLYSCTQSINVVENMKTNLWKESSSASSPISNDTFTLTDALITSFERTQIYVGDTSVGTASESGSGSPYAPLATFEKALSIIENQGASNKDYTIWISGNFTGTKTLSSSLDGKAQSITISGTSGNSTDVLDGINEGTTLTVNTSVPVTIKNLKITGGSAENGGGINNSGTLSLSDGCLVSGNTASNFGGGVYSTGTMFMYGSAVIGDSTKNESATESGYSNKAGCGGGIYSTGNLYLGYSESNTKTELTGGVFYNFSANTGGIYQYGPGEESSSDLKLDSGFVSYNAERGIYAGKCTFTMTGGTINGNKAFDDTSNAEIRGAGFYAGTTCTALISGGTIRSNMAAGNGGGIYIAQDNSYVTLKGGTISSNTADGNGNGIALMNGALKMQDGAKVDSSNDVYLASGKVITVTGELTGTTPVATITPAAWTRGTTIVQADGTNLTTLKDDEYDYTDYFALTDEDWVTKPSTDNKSLMIDAPIYVASKGTDSRRKVCAAADSFTGTATGSKSKPFATIEDALSVLNAESNMITIDGNVVGNQQILSSKVPSSVTSVAIAGYKESGAASSEAKLNGNGSGTVLTVNKSGLEVSIEDLEITGGNTSYGGGLAVDSGTAKLLDGAKITGNTATVKGGGVYLGPSTKLVMEGSSTISGNSAASGGAVYNAGTFNMSGNALVDSTNDVYLESGKVITVTGKLESTTTVAKITPSTYTDSVQVLDLAINPTPATTLLSEYKKFEVVPDGSTKYYISSDGKIFSTKPATHFTTVPTSGTTVGLVTIDDFKKVAEWVGDSNELSEVTLSLLTDVTLDSSFTPVGEYHPDYEVEQGEVSKVFTGGTFDGNNKTITYNNVSFTQNYSGIFSGAKNATIQNLNLEGTLNVNANSAGGALIGHAEACIIKNCSSSVNITAGSSAKYYLGGIVGKAEGSYISGQKLERNCYILDCVNTSSIIADNGMYIGGIAGSASVCVIRNCINKGNISGVKMCGGIVGSTTLYGSDNYGSLIENCGNNGNITATSDYFSSEGSVGGIAGGPTAGNEEWAPKINNCYSSGTITAQNNKAGGIFGYLKNRCTLSKCYYYNPDQACQDGSPDSGSSKYTDVSNILDDMNSLSNSDSENYRKWKVSGSVLEFE